MKSWLLSAVAAGVLIVPCQAQEKPAAPPPVEVLPAPTPEGAPPACGYIESCKTTWQLHWLEREVPGVVSKPVLREVTTPCTKPSFEIEWNQAVVTKTEVVLKPREIVKEVTICTQKPKVVKDPCTGCSTVIFEPVTETKLVKEITYCLESEEKTVTVRTPFLKPVEIPIVRKSLVLDHECENVVRRERFGVLVPVEIKERKPCAPPCPPPPPLPCNH